VGSFHDDCVLYLRVPDDYVVSDAGVGAYIGVWTYFAVVADDSLSSYCGPAVDDCALTYADYVR
jgi:hypothetical protein